jgi:hypothetical protein
MERSPFQVSMRVRVPCAVITAASLLSAGDPSASALVLVLVLVLVLAAP